MIRKIKINLCQCVFGKNYKINIYGPFSEEKLDNENKSLGIYEAPAEVEDFVIYFSGNESCVSADPKLEEIFEKEENGYDILKEYYDENKDLNHVEFSIEQGYDTHVYVFKDIYNEAKDLSDDELKIKFLTLKNVK